MDTLIYLLQRKIIETQDSVTSEKELHRKDGFRDRRHQPDFIFIKDNKTTAVEIELSIKSIYRLENNMKDNFLTYDNQIWFIRRKNKRIERNIRMLIPKYSGVSIFYLEEVYKDGRINNGY
jgi:hypothetical protein